MSLKVKKISMEKNTKRDIIIFLLTFLIVYIPVFLLLDFYIKDYIISVQIFTSSQFTQMTLSTLDTLIVILLVFNLIPYVSFIFISGILVLFLSRGKYRLSRTIPILIISIALSTIIHIAVIYNWFINNDLEIKSRALDNLVNIDINDLTNQISNISQYFILVYIIDSFESADPSNQIIYFFLYYFYIKTTEMPIENSYNNLIIYDSWFVFLYFIIIFSFLFVIFNLTCECEFSATSKEKKNYCSKRDIIVIILCSIIFFLPIINLMQLYQQKSINYVDWDLCYNVNNLNNNHYSFSGSSDNYSIGSFQLQEFLAEQNLSYIKIPIAGQNFSIKGLGSEGFEVTNPQNFYYERLYDTKSSNQINRINIDFFGFTTNSTIRNSNELGLIEKNSSLWNEIDLYIYAIADDNRTAFGYKISNYYSLTSLDYEEIEFYSQITKSNILLTCYVIDYSGEYNIEGHRVMLNHNPSEFLDVIDTYAGIFYFLEQFYPFTSLFGFQDFQANNIRYYANYLHIKNGSANLRINQTGITFRLTQANLFLGKINDINDVIYNIVYIDLGIIALIIAGLFVITYMNKRDPKIHDIQQSCDLHKFSQSPEYKFREFKIKRKNLKK